MNRRLDTCDRSGRIAHLVVEWASQYDNLTNAFLTYKQNCTPPPLSDNEAENFSIEVVNLFGALSIPVMSAYLTFA